MSNLTPDKLGFFLSGGPSNMNPLLSLGGQRSNSEVSAGLNSLFRDLTDDEARSGLTDYRCFYILNKAPSGTLYGASIHIESSDCGDQILSLGTARRAESQVISVVGPVFFGAVTFSFGGQQFSASWGGSPNAFAANLSSGLASIGVLGSEVNLSFSGSTNKFTVAFGGLNNNRAQPLIQVVDNFLEGVTTPSIAVTRQTLGLPINTAAPQIATQSTPPAGVEFQATSPSSKMTVGTLAPGDRMPVWIRRQTPAASDPKQGSNIVVRVSGDAS